jgi:hypothetical protein
MTSPDGGKLWITQVVLSKRDMVPRNAAEVRKMAELEGAKPVPGGSVPGLALGSVLLLRPNSRNGELLAFPAGSPAQILLLQGAGTPVQTLLDLAASARR